MVDVPRVGVVAAVVPRVDPDNSPASGIRERCCGALAAEEVGGLLVCVCDPVEYEETSRAVCVWGEAEWVVVLDVVR